MAPVAGRGRQQRGRWHAQRLYLRPSPRQKRPLGDRSTKQAELANHGQVGLVSSIRKTGPPRKSGASALTKDGASPPRTHTCESGGCLSRSGATIPATPPIFTFTT